MHPQHGHRDVADTLFDSNLTEFAAQVNNICALEVGGKLTPEEAYNRIKRHWKSLKRSKRNLLDDEVTPAKDDGNHDKK